MNTQIEKQQFQNQTDGWLGVTVIGPRGEDRGAAVEPGGTVWLSEQEQMLTANAPRKPEDNPFIEQTLVRTNPETGESEEVKVTPLIPISEERYVPAQARFVPGLDGNPGAVAQQAATGDEPVVPLPADLANNALARHEQLADGDPKAKPNVTPPPAAAAAAAHAAQQSAVAQAEAEAAAAAQEPPEQPLPPSMTPEPPVVPTPPEPTPDETAAAVDPAVGEETGAAPPPTGDAPEGEYAQAEEVGTPVGGSVGSPAAEPGSDTESDAAPPAPYSPPEE